MYGEGNRGGGFRPRGGPVGFAPVKVGDEVDVRIEALGDKGDGIARKDGFVIVIPKSKVDDEVRIKITKVLRSVAFGEVVGKAEEKLKAKTIDQIEDVEPEVYEDSEDFGEDL